MEAASVYIGTSLQRAFSWCSLACMESFLSCAGVHGMDGLLLCGHCFTSHHATRICRKPNHSL